MTAESWSSRIRHDSDAAYREWRDDLISRLQNHLTLADTNITPGAGSRPGTNSEQGYATFYLDDALHGTAPIYIRFGFGTGGNASGPRLQVVVGTTNNGSGTVAGTASSGTVTLCSGTAAQTSDTNRQSVLSSQEGFFALAFKLGGDRLGGLIVVCRTCDSSATPTATGAITLLRSNNGLTSQLYNDQMFRYAGTETAFNVADDVNEAAIAVNPHARTTSGTPQQVALTFTAVPEVAPCFGIVGVFGISGTPEIAALSTFQTINVGSTPRTFIVMPAHCGALGGIDPDSSTQGSLFIGFLYE